MIENRNEKQLMKYYGITLNELKQMYKNQNGVCEICKRGFKNTRDLVIDHDHETGKTRAILCRSCNSTVGWIENTPIFKNKRYKEYLKYLFKSE